MIKSLFLFINAFNLNNHIAFLVKEKQEVCVYTRSLFYSEKLNLNCKSCGLLPLLPSPPKAAISFLARERTLFPSLFSQIN